MKRFVLLLAFALVLARSLSAADAPKKSPSGQYEATAEFGRCNPDSPKELCIRLHIVETQTKKEYTFQTDAAKYIGWAFGWSKKNILLLYSSDVGIYAYEIIDGGLRQRTATKEEQEEAREFYKEKYGKSP